MPTPSLPPTTPLYHASSTRQMTARVLAVLGSEVALDATAFYPAGGGQGADTGKLRWDGGEAAVTDTRKDAQGVVWHRLDGGLPASGQAVEGEVDAARRWRHMQRHSGEHLLAQAFLRVNPAFQVAAVSMNGPECTLDLRGDPTWADVQAAQTLLSETLGRSALTLETPVVPEAELGRYPLRRETKVRGEVRLVIFRDADGTPFDVSACGGTHMPFASQCLPVVVLRTERVRGGLTRVVFMAGEEATAHLSRVHEQARALAQGFSVPVEALPERVAALRAEAGSLAAQTDALRSRLAALLVSASPSEPLPGGGEARLVTLDDPALLLPVLSGVQPGEVRGAVTSGGRCGVSSAHPDHDAGRILRAVLVEVGGKGGGRADLAQGQTPDGPEFLAGLRRTLRDAS